MLTVSEATRVALGLTQMSLASMAGVSQTAISRLESGTPELSEDALDAVAAVLGVSAAFLRLPAPHVQLLHRMKDSVAATAVKRVTAEFTLAFLRSELLAPGIRHSVRPVSVDNPDASARAERLRHTWRMTPGPIRDIVALLESQGIVCLRRDLIGLKVNALAARSGKHRAVMLLDPRPDVEDALWAIAHELGHLALHEAADAGQEDSADEFAGEFLAPHSEIRRMLRERSDADIDELPDAFRMPPAQFAVHARRSRLITVADYRRLRTQCTPPWHRDELAGPSRIATAVRDRVDVGETQRDVAASAFLSEDELRRDYL